MSAQSVIDSHIKQNIFNITVNKESGDVIVPEHANVHFYDCDLGNFTVKGNSAIFIGRGRVTGKVYTENCQFLAQDTGFLGEIIWAKNTIVKSITGSVFGFRITAKDNTTVTIFNCSWDGFGSFAMYALDKSRVNLTNCILTRREKGAWALNGSFIDLTNCIIGTSIGIIVDDNSQVNMIGGELKATTLGAHVMNKSQLYLSSLLTPVIATTYHVLLENDSKLLVSKTDFSPIPPTSIKATNKCLVEAVNCGSIKSTAGDCIDLQDSTARFINVKTIQSLGGSAIKASSNSLVNTVQCETIEGLGKHGIDISTNTKLEAVKCKTIKGVAGGIKADSDCSVSLDHCQTIKGQSDPGIKLSSNTRGYLSKIKDVTSDGSNGIELTDNSDISLQDHDNVTGTGGHGIKASSDCAIQLQTVKSVKGVAGDGINASSSTNVDVLYTTSVEGSAGWGINASSNCSVKVTRSTKIKGTLGGIQVASGGNLLLERIAIIDASAGSGVLTSNDVDGLINLVDLIKKGVSASNSHTKIKDCPAILNDSGAAISANGGELDIKTVIAVGSTNALTLSNALATANAITFTGNINASSSELEINNSAIIGNLTTTGSEININKSIITGNVTSSSDEYSFKKTGMTGNMATATSNMHLSTLILTGNVAVAGSTLEVEKSTLTGTLDAIGSSRVELESVVVTGAITFAGSELEMHNASMGGVVTLSGGSLEMAFSSLLGLITAINADIGAKSTTVIALTVTGCSVDLDLASITGVLTSAGSDIQCLSSTAASAVLTDSNIIITGGDLGAIVIDAFTSVLACGTGSSISGVGNVIAVNTGSVSDLQNKIVVGGTEVLIKNVTGSMVDISTTDVLIKNSLNAAVDINATNIFVDALTAGGNVTISSTAFTSVD